MSSVDEILAGYDGLQAAAFGAHFGDRAAEWAQQTTSEDFSDIPRALGAPYTYWGIGYIDRGTYHKAMDAGRVAQDIPVNHSPNFAPVIQPTCDTGTQALVIAALAWLGSWPRVTPAAPAVTDLPTTQPTPGQLCVPPALSVVPEA